MTINECRVCDKKFEAATPSRLTCSPECAAVRQRRSGPSGRARRLIFIRDGYRCLYCGDELTVATAAIDHVHPWCEGGPSTPDNLVTSCRSCNAYKHRRPLPKRAEEQMRAYARQASALIKWLPEYTKALNNRGPPRFRFPPYKGPPIAYRGAR